VGVGIVDGKMEGNVRQPKEHLEAVSIRKREATSADLILEFRIDPSQIQFDFRLPPQRGVGLGIYRGSDSTGLEIR